MHSQHLDTLNPNCDFFNMKHCVRMSQFFLQQSGNLGPDKVLRNVTLRKTMKKNNWHKFR